MEVNKLLLQALGTKPDGISELKLTKWSSDRATSCGKPNADTAGTVVGDNLATDIVCLCASDGTNTGNKACGTKADGPTVQFTAVSNDLKAAWKGLASECKTQFPTLPLTASNLKAAIRHFEIEVARPQGTDDVLTNTLGFIKGAGSTGCSGGGNGNDGSCVYYGREPTDKGPLRPAWVTPLTSASVALQQAEQAQARSFSLSQKLKTLNDKLTSLILFGSSIRSSQRQPTNQPSTGDATEIDAQKAAKKECEQHKSNKTTCESTGKCKWNGGDSEDEGECTVDESKVKEQTNTAGTGETANAGPNCASHNDKTNCEKQNVGKDKPVCGWRKGKDNEDDKDTEKCRNGSFLSNKKFALIDAFFMRLLVFFKNSKRFF
uniref:Variant surface glycoprotein 1125.2114 n=1 Tax=Trypanosoma brucei TaxID=5691 RepID=A0A1J0R835_9TRYP|nr:variant surface glycoprotein 1125.2114 [Trypanosoma brucei]